MEKVTYQWVEVDRCTQCHGLWFERRERELLKNMAGAASIDIGPTESSAEFSKKEDIVCPTCQVKMMKMIDPKQPHIWFESCPSCYGSFFDAGEFKDYKGETLLDLFKGLFTKGRE
jgi:Zn-finger nucleic acid-binding protein